MGRIITLMNGEIKPVIDFSDVAEIIRNELGDEVADCVDSEIDEWCSELNYYRDEYEDADKACQMYCTAILKAQCEIGDVISMLKKLDTVEVMKDLDECINRLTLVKEDLEET